MARNDVLVSADWAQENLGAPGLVFVEVDEDTSAYDKGHIKGAVKLDWTTELQDQVRRDFVNKQQFEELLSGKGIANDDTVVLYGGNNNWFAAYAYWYFKLYGHSDVKLLDGGRKKWELDSRELTDEVPTREKTSYTAQEQDLSIRAFRDDIAGVIGVGNIMLVVVKERTREIGLRKALGATPATISLMIIHESLVITLIAGYAGLVAGILLLEGIRALLIKLGQGEGMFASPYIDINIAAMALAVLVVTGVLAALLPALKAASVNPITALQDE